MKLRRQLNLPVSTLRVQKMLHDAEFLEYCTLKKAPRMNALCRHNRFKWCRKYICEDERSECTSSSAMRRGGASMVLMVSDTTCRIPEFHKKTSVRGEWLAEV